MKLLLPVVSGLLLLAAPAAGQAQFLFTTNADGVSLTITGYTGSGGAVTIPGTINGLTVVSIGDNAFMVVYYPPYGGSPPSASMTSVTIPASVTNIGDYAFAFCDGVTNVSLSDGLLSIGDNAFGGCEVTGVTIPASVTHIGLAPFENCPMTAITVEAGNSFYTSINGVLFDGPQTSLLEFPSGRTGSYTIPPGVTTIGADAFVWCSGLTSVTIPGSVTSLEDSAFQHCNNLTSVAMPNSVTSIGDYVFYECFSLTGFSLPDSVTNIGAGAFGQCNGLTSVVIPNGVTSIAEDAFQSCAGLRSVTIPGSVTNIADYAFFECSSLASVFFTGDAPAADLTVFGGDSGVTAYYRSGPTGWGSRFAGVPAVLWNPQILTGGVNFGVRTNQFGFNLTGPSNLVVVVAACTNLANPVWTPLQTVTLTNGGFYFSDPQWTHYPARYYLVTPP